MKRREFLGGLGAGALVASTTRLKAKPVAAAEETAEEIYKRSFVTDALCFGAAPPPTYVPYLTDSKIEALRTSGITALSMCMSSGASKKVDNLFAEIKANIEKWDAFVAKHSDVFLKVTSAALLDEAKRTGKTQFLCRRLLREYKCRTESLRIRCYRGLQQKPDSPGSAPCGREVSA